MNSLLFWILECSSPYHTSTFTWASYYEPVILPLTILRSSFSLTSSAVRGQMNSLHDRPLVVAFHAFILVSYCVADTHFEELHYVGFFFLLSSEKMTFQKNIYFFNFV